MKRWRHAGERLRRCEAGAAAIEFAIIALVMIFVCLAVIEFGRGLWVRNQLSYVADYAAREILLGIDDAEDDEKLKNEIRERFHGGDPALLEIEITPIPEDDYRTIELRYPFTLLIPGLTNDAITLSLLRRIPTI